MSIYSAILFRASSFGSEWYLPMKTEQPTTEKHASIMGHQAGLLHHIISNSRLKKHVTSRSYTELTNDLAENINNDLALFPQLRYSTSQPFSGAILVEGHTAILVNCVEPYGRQKSVDAHYERRFEGAQNSSSYPKTLSPISSSWQMTTTTATTTLMKTVLAAASHSGGGERNHSQSFEKD
ncbi:unnamed protein product [Absidia cylindrospora]